MEADKILKKNKKHWTFKNNLIKKSKQLCKLPQKTKSPQMPQGSLIFLGLDL